MGGLIAAGLTSRTAARSQGRKLAAARSERSQLTEALAAVRARLVLVALLLALAGAAWLWAADQMSGMDAGPGTDLGTVGWFEGVWVAMMTAMMLPSLAPTTALYVRMTRRRGIARPLLFNAGYLAVWCGAGLGAYGLVRVGRETVGGELAWSAGGRWFAAGVLAVAALYELTPLKDVCLGKCRSPLAFLLGAWRDGWSGALEMGARHAAWCLGCCWALMAALFALGVMSLVWMALVAALIALEKTIPWRRVATRGTATVLLSLAIAVAVAPHDLPGLVTPGGSGSAVQMMGAVHHSDEDRGYVAQRPA